MDPNSPSHAQAMWRWCLASAFRTALACIIVGFTTLYGPTSFLHQVAFPSFSFVTVVLVITDATLGDTVLACWLAIYATIQSLVPAMLSLWLIGPARFSAYTISLAVGLAAFVVALPEGTHLVSKRIALGQIVLMYMIAYINGIHTEPIMHPVHVAASTAVGVLACVLASLLPYPRLACWEVKENCKMVAENISERLKLYVKAFCSDDNSSVLASISQAKLLASASTKFLQNIKRYQESMKWEIIPFKIFGHYSKNPGEKLQEVETTLRGMEMALTNISSSSERNVVNGETKQGLIQLENHVINQTLKQIKNCQPICPDSTTVPESKVDNIVKSIQTLQTTPTKAQDLPSLFFLFCMKLLYNTSLPKPAAAKPEADQTSSKKTGFFLKNMLANFGLNMGSTERLMPAFKVSLSLGLAVLFGSIYSKENGYWSGLPVAISVAASREPTFKIANVKAQGTVIGTVYGVLGCFVFEKYLPIRFLSLIPWFIITSLLRRSRMYGQAGGISAVIGAVLILGRKNFGPPSEFAIARITETFIGLSCSIVVDLLFQPTRAASLAKTHLSRSFARLHACIGSISLKADKGSLVQDQKRLKLEVSELGKFIAEAEVEPNFWFLPFNGGCYGKLIGSLSRMVDLLLFSAHAIGFLEVETTKIAAAWRDQNLSKLDGDILLFKDMLSPLIKSFEVVTLLKSVTFLDNQLKEKNISHDIEMGKSPNRKIFRISGSENEDEMKKLIDSYLQHLKEVVDKLNEQEGDDESRGQMVLFLSALGFCLNNLVKESREIEKAINELLQWENPSCHINLFEISCKIHALCD